MWLTRSGGPVQSLGSRGGKRKVLKLDHSGYYFRLTTGQWPSWRWISQESNSATSDSISLLNESHFDVSMEYEEQPVFLSVCMWMSCCLYFRWSLRLSVSMSSNLVCIFVCVCMSFKCCESVHLALYMAGTAENEHPFIWMFLKIYLVYTFPWIDFFHQVQWDLWFNYQPYI